MKEAEFVRRFHKRLMARYGQESVYFVKIPTGKFGGFRPFDAVAALRFREENGAILYHYVLEFKVQRSTVLTVERLKKEARHQFLALREAEAFFCPLYVIYEEKPRTMRLLYMGTDEEQFKQARFLDVWSSQAKIEKAEFPPETPEEKGPSDA